MKFDNHVNFKDVYIKLINQYLKKIIILREIKRFFEFKALGSGSMLDPARIQTIYGSMDPDPDP